MHYFAQYCEPVFDIFLEFRYVKVTIDSRNTNSSSGVAQ